MIYAVNWLNVGAIFVLMGPDLGSGVGGLGALTSAFYLGIGLAQIPGGVMAARWGPRNTVVVGVLLSSLSALGTSAATDIAQATALRFLVGAGMALVFAPAVVIVARLIRGGRTGTGVGLFNSAFDIGGVVGIFGWVVLATIIGWRPSLALSGGIGVMTGLLIMVFVPDDLPTGDFRVESSRLKNVLADKQLVLLGLGTLGLSAGNIVISSFMGYYVVKTFDVSPSVGGAVQGLVVGVPIFTALWGGRAYDRMANHRLLMELALLGGAVALVFAAYPAFWSAVLCSALGGAVSGIGYSIAFAGAKDLNRAGERYDGLAVAWVNSISLTGSFVPPLIFSYLVATANYPIAWLGGSLMTIVFILPLWLMTERFH
jgi:MFS family permease